MIKSIRPTIILYFSWIIISLLAYTLSMAIPQGHGLFAYIFLAGFKLLSILVLMIITTCFLVFQEDHLQTQPKLRILLMLLFACIEMVLIISIRFSGRLTLIPAIMVSANLIVFALLIGSWLTHPLKRVVDLILLCYVMSLADVYSVFIGPSKTFTHRISDFYKGGMQGTPPASDFLLIKFPVAGSSLPYPLFGVSDWLIIVFFSAAVLKFKLHDNLIGKSVASIHQAKRFSPYLPISVVGLVFAILLSSLTHIFLPALPLIAGFFIVYLVIRFPESRQLNRSDWKIILLFSLFFFIIAMIHKTILMN